MNRIKKIILLSVFLVTILSLSAQEVNKYDCKLAQQEHSSFFGVEKFVFNEAVDGYFPLANNGMPANVISDEDDKGVQRAVGDLCEDIFRVTGYHPLTFKPNAVVIGTIGQSKIIDRLVSEGKIDGSQLRGKTEKYIITTLKDENINFADHIMVVAGSDKRGTIYGIYEISRQIGVSPWYWWADVPVRHQANLFVKPGVYTDGEPQVRYRGIFINDEAPAFQGWCKEKFGGVNSKMYEHMFELILRLKGNFLWPAMWGNMFYYDDPRNGELANDMGIVIGTSHHEPMGRAHEEWKVFGSGSWNYQTNSTVLDKFWKGGMERMKNYEKIVTIGMRGDGDEAMSPMPNLSLLENIVKSQRQIIQNVTGKKAEETPQAWALYKEVQDYYDRGMRVPDDVTLLLCDDNWGNVRKLPDIDAKPRKGGYGMYYHFDYVGAPRNCKWLNVSQISRTWEQMNLCYTHGVRQIWVVNVGDLKPMEYPISFFLDMAWNPKRFHAQNLEQWNEQWCTEQFGEKYAKEAARLMNLHTQYATRVTPELLTSTTYSLDNYEEFERVLNDYRSLAIDAFRIYNLLPADARDAFDELVLFPVNAVCNLYEMYYAVAMNGFYAAKNDSRANAFADKAKECFARDAQLTEHYNKDIADGKWAHQMDQVRIGYTQWNDPATSIMPKVEYVLREVPKEKIFIEKDKYISIEAENFAKSNGNGQIHWEVIPNLGRTKSGVTTMPANAYPKDVDNIYIEYNVRTQTDGEATANIWLAPTLNFNANKGLRFALSVDGGTETVVNFNGHYKGELGDWQGYRIIKSATKLNFGESGNHTLRIRVLEPGIVFEKIMLDFGGLKPTYLGAPESEYK
ncbi:glycosyl hydrolase 115 family protein [Dysgonomonas macrotermitis]|uniref:Glycosyl hydrolase family 115 n=1 Tax=Dysgonomonas macrotermitis TaxID=1346286 RepID=A0A1M5JIM4_9BACT|nr:glycosyl hydrolase 115 family protein [Dysgonomonas macrotermitis]SHG39883.1 Glycosyl hydrolase family 115 [Dysgonomonas macrotermitis]